MRRLAESDMANIAGSTVEGYVVEAVRVKRGPFCDSDHYGIILGRNVEGHYVCWQFHLEEDDTVNAYWGHYFMENREAALRDYDTRDLNIDKDAVWKEYLRYLRGWADAHSGSGFYGMTPACFDEWYGSEYQDAEESEEDSRSSGTKDYRVTITETLKLTVDVEAKDRQEAEQITAYKWRSGEYVLDADNFVGVEFEAVTEEQESSEIPG